MKILLLLVLINSIGCYKKNDIASELLNKKASDEQNMEALKKEFIISNNKKRYNIGLKLLSQTLKKQNYKMAEEYYRILIGLAEKVSDKIVFLQKKADLNFYKLYNYDQAVQDYSNLLFLETGKFKNGLNLAKSYFKLNQLIQAEVELENILELAKSRSQNFDYLYLKSNILFSNKKYRLAIELYQKIIKDFKDEAKAHNIELNLAMSLEGVGAIQKAIDVLKNMESDFHTPQFISNKVKHLQSKLAKLPQPGRLKR